MKSKAYPKYKLSGVEWLGDVPEHWEVKRTRFILSLNPSKQEIKHLDPDTELAFLPMEAVGEDSSLRLDTTKPISEVSAGYTFSLRVMFHLQKLHHALKMARALSCVTWVLVLGLPYNRTHGNETRQKT